MRAFVQTSILLFALTTSTLAHAQTELASLSPSDPINAGAFGFATAISGDTALVTQRNGLNASNAATGAAYVYLRTAGIWSQQAKLTGSTVLAAGDFGRSAAISGDTIAVSAAGPISGNQVGKVFIFTRTGSAWAEQAVLLSPTTANADFFGSGVALDGDTLVVGSNGQRKAMVYARSGSQWNLQSTLTDADDSTGFGAAVALSGTTIIVGAPGYFNGAVSQGGAFAFGFSGGAWSQIGNAIIASNGAAGHLFGTQVAINADTVVIGSPNYFAAPGTQMLPQGSAYVFQRTAGVFTLQAQLNAVDASAGDRFGSAVAVNADQVIVGAPFDNAVTPAGSNVRGSAHLFERNGSTWSASTLFAPTIQVNGERFGRGVAFDGVNAVIGADQSNSAATPGPGKAVIFALKTGIFDNGFEGNARAAGLAK